MKSQPFGWLFCYPSHNKHYREKIIVYANTPPGMIVTADVELINIDGNHLYFTVEANDGVDIIAKGTHERCIVDRQTFINQISKKKSYYHDT